VLDRHRPVIRAVKHQRGARNRPSNGRTSTRAAQRNIAATVPGEEVLRSTRAAHSRYRALSRIAAACAASTAPVPHPRAAASTHASI
jgi:hypothetical protein